jgi:hypothetical protein
MPNADGWFSTDEYDVHLQYNSRGIRPLPTPPDKPPGTYRVVLFGDSLSRGYGGREDASRAARSAPRRTRAAKRGRGTPYARLSTGRSSRNRVRGVKYHPDISGDDVLHERRLVQRAVEVLAREAVSWSERRAELTGVPVPDTRPRAKKRRRSGPNCLDPGQLQIVALPRCRSNSSALRTAATRLRLIAPREKGGESGPHVADATQRVQFDHRRHNTAGR